MLYFWVQVENVQFVIGKATVFLPNGIKTKKRFDAKCPQCDSLERHRFSFLVAQKSKLDYSNILHIAPEKSISLWLKNFGKKYTSIDISGNFMIKMDLRKLEFENDHFSLIWCSNVLEHIEEDNLAISEMFRVLKPGGFAIIQVPIWRITTYENYKIQNNKDRLKQFFEKDHVRLYGYDIIDRFNKVGFISKIIRVQEFPPELIFKHSLTFISTNEIFLLKKE